jgi:hypothetical protein
MATVVIVMTMLMAAGLVYWHRRTLLYYLSANYMPRKIAAIAPVAHTLDEHDRVEEENKALDADDQCDMDSDSKNGSQWSWSSTGVGSSDSDELHRTSLGSPYSQSFSSGNGPSDVSESSSIDDSSESNWQNSLIQGSAWDQLYPSMYYDGTMYDIWVPELTPDVDDSILIGHFALPGEFISLNHTWDDLNSEPMNDLYYSPSSALLSIVTSDVLLENNVDGNDVLQNEMQWHLPANDMPVLTPSQMLYWSIDYNSSSSSWSGSSDDESADASDNTHSTCVSHHVDSEQRSLSALTTARSQREQLLPAVEAETMMEPTSNQRGDRHYAALQNDAEQLYGQEPRVSELAQSVFEPVAQFGLDELGRCVTVRSLDLSSVDMLTENLPMDDVSKDMTAVDEGQFQSETDQQYWSDDIQREFPNMVMDMSDAVQHSNWLLNASNTTISPLAFDEEIAVNMDYHAAPWMDITSSVNMSNPLDVSAQRPDMLNVDTSVDSTMFTSVYGTEYAPIVEMQSSFDSGIGFGMEAENMPYDS